MFNLVLKRFIAVSVLAFLVLSTFATWKWLDHNVLHWGVEDSRVTRVDRTELIEKLRAFEVVTVKHSYNTKAGTEVEKELRAGPIQVSLPGWLAGQQLDVRGEVTVAAGIDLSGLTPDDIEVVRGADGVHVIINVAEAKLTSTALVPGTMDIDTNQGVLTRFRSRIGLEEKDLRDQAVDRLVQAAEQAALKDGILLDAAREASNRLGAFLGSLPQTGSQKVTYEIRVSQPPAA